MMMDVPPKDTSAPNTPLKKIGTNARYEIEKQLEMKVNLQLWVKVRKDWRDSELLMKNYGYINEK